MKLVLRFDGTPAALGALRTNPDWEVLAAGSQFWARAFDTPENRAEAALLPADARYVENAGLLAPLGSELPIGPVPLGEWKSAGDVIEVGRTSAQLAGVSTASIPLELVASSEPQTTGALLVDWETFARWAGEAPAVRLSRLRIAVSASDKALVRGTPLPPMQGREYYWSQSLAIPCGFALAAHLWPELIQERLALRPADSALLHPDGRVDVITEEQWSEVSRSSIELMRRAKRSNY